MKIQAEVIYIPTEKGGRKGPMADGYRPQFYYDGNDWDANQTFPYTKIVYPGDTVTAEFTFLHPTAHNEKIKPGLIFLLREGYKVVGYGKVKLILEG